MANGCCMKTCTTTKCKISEGVYILPFFGAAPLDTWYARCKNAWCRVRCSAVKNVELEVQNEMLEANGAVPRYLDEQSIAALGQSRWSPQPPPHQHQTRTINVKPMRSSSESSPHLSSRFGPNPTLDGQTSRPHGNRSSRSTESCHSKYFLKNWRFEHEALIILDRVPPKPHLMSSLLVIPPRYLTRTL